MAYLSHVLAVGFVVGGLIMSFMVWIISRNAKQDLDNDDRKYMAVGNGMVAFGLISQILGGVIGLVILLAFCIWAIWQLRQRFKDDKPTWRGIVSWWTRQTSDSNAQ